METLLIKSSFINAAIEIGASKGINAINRRSLVSVSNVNQLYLYQEFKDIYDVQFQAFSYINRIFVNIVLRALRELEVDYSPNGETAFFNVLWREMKANSQRFEYFLRYYYNYIFPQYYASEETKNDLQPVLEAIKKYFKEGIDLERIIIHLLEDVVKYTVLVRNKKYPDNEETDKEVFRCIFSFMYPYLVNKPFREIQV